ncbi:DinB family protein [Tistrella sp. BH-R2-4]|uniref:DinB family protein n=1 Tax=Tistrella arctica TaxID=3133430 RepID=A0ABU9YD49_9PROT
MDMPAYFGILARYNAWANLRLYDAVARLSSTEFERPRAAFFGSLMGVMNHMVVVDELFLSRLNQTQAPDRPLSAQPWPHFNELRSVRMGLDQRILGTVAALPAARFTKPFRYTTTRGDAFADDLGLFLGHWFNHQTHHRGQAHDMLTQTEVPPPPLDFLIFQRVHGLSVAE